MDTKKTEYASADEPILGILGGLGPMSSVYFCEMLTAHTKAGRDQEHLNFLLSSRADTPDRTAFLLGRSEQNPLPAMTREAQRLEKAGASLIALPCNTAHCFYEGIQASVSVPVVNIIRQNADFCRFLGLSRVGVLATEGTVLSGAYRKELNARGIEYETCDERDQAVVSSIIYEQIKVGLAPDPKAFFEVVSHLTERGCDRIILGCTELSLLKRQLSSELLIDSLEVLALCAIRLCGKEPIGFSPELMRFFPANPFVRSTRKETPHAAL